VTPGTPDGVEKTVATTTMNVRVLRYIKEYLLLFLF